MARIDRRNALRLTGAVTFAALLHVRPAFARLPGSVPTGQFRFTRSLSRELANGNEIVVTRTWRLAISTSGGGWRIDGQQVDAQVEAPSALAEFAALEQARTDTSAFPILLGRDRLIAGHGGEADTALLEKALSAARKRIGDAPLSNEHKTDARIFLSQVQISASEQLSHPPADLFFPRATPRMRKRSIPLPDGGSGEITLFFEAETDPTTGLMTSAGRTIETVLGADTRNTRERWTLTPST